MAAMFAEKIVDNFVEKFSITSIGGHDLCRDLQFQIMAVRSATKLDLEEAEKLSEALNSEAAAETLAKECQELEERRQALREELEEKERAGANILVSIEGAKEKLQAQLEALRCQEEKVKSERQQLLFEAQELQLTVERSELTSQGLKEDLSRLQHAMGQAAETALADFAAEREGRLRELREACEEAEAEASDYGAEALRWQSLNSFRAQLLSAKQQKALAAKAAAAEEAEAAAREAEEAKYGQEALQLAARQLQLARWFPLAAAVLAAPLCHAVRLLIRVPHL